MNRRREMQVLVFLAIVSVSLAQSTAPAPALVTDCSNQTALLIPCLDYVEGKVKSPTKECCSGLSTVTQKNVMCLCSLIAEAGSGGASLGVNVTIALGLPQACGIKNVSINECPGAPALLGPAPPPSEGGETTPRSEAPASSGSQRSAYVYTTTIGVYLALVGVVLLL